MSVLGRVFVGVVVVGLLGVLACAPGEGEVAEFEESPFPEGSSGVESPTDTDTDSGSGDLVVSVVEFLGEEYPGAVVGELEYEGGYFGVEVFDLGAGTEFEFDVAPGSLETWDHSEDGLGEDDRVKAEAVEVGFLDAFETASVEAGDDALFDEVELGSEGGVVVWEFEFVNDVEVYVDVSAGDVVKVD